MTDTDLILPEDYIQVATETKDGKSIWIFHKTTDYEQWLHDHYGDELQSITPL